MPDVLWKEIAPLLPLLAKPHRFGGGRPRVPDRTAMDAVGNIITIQDYSGNNAAASTTYTYDNLYRLTRASSTDAVLTNWLQTYAYDDLGNITSKSDVGSYTYAGTGFANPHAATTINGVTYGYDAAGNLTSAGAAAYTWNYRNRLTDTNNSGTTTHYAYDYNDQRVIQAVNMGSGTTTTTYWSKLFETKGATTTLYVFLPNGELLATVEGNGTATSTYIAHTDHQGGTNVMSDKDGNLAQLATYYPYGSKRNNELPSNGFNEKRGFIGQYEDAATQLSYLNARYYNGGNGQFLSQDPVFNRDPNRQTLGNPQSLNSYSYANNNPINFSDPNGEAAKDWVQGAIVSILQQALAITQSLYQMVAHPMQYAQSTSQAAQGVINNPSGTLKAIGQNVQGRVDSIVNAPNQAARDYAWGYQTFNIIPTAVLTLRGGGLLTEVGATKAGTASLDFGKVSTQLDKRGWTTESVQNTVDNPFTTRAALNKANGNPATAYYNKDGTYVSVENGTGNILQVTNNARVQDGTWLPDNTIINPYTP